MLNNIVKNTIPNDAFKLSKPLLLSVAPKNSGGIMPM